MASYEFHRQMYLSKRDQVFKLGKKVFGSFDAFDGWLDKKGRYAMLATVETLDQLEEKLLQMDGGYCL